MLSHHRVFSAQKTYFQVFSLAESESWELRSSRN